MYKNLIKVSTVGMSHEDWLAHRKNAIGGSDAAGIVGMNQYSSPYSIWAEKLDKLPPIKEYEAQPLTQAEMDEMAGTDRRFEITREDDGVFFVEAPWLESIMRTVNMEDYSSMQYFQRVLRNSGIIDKLEQMGIKEGDTVNIFGFEFDFVLLAPDLY